MSGFGDLLSGIGELFSGIAEVAAERGAEAVVEAAVHKTVEASDETATFERYLTGGPRALNVNDL
jgi:hypothetical protein